MSEGEGGVEVKDGAVVVRSGLSEEEVARLTAARKQIWRGGYAGFAVGGIWGFGNCLVYRFLHNQALQRFQRQEAFKAWPRLQNKHLVMWSLVGAATGMFLGAGSEGIRVSESLRDVYEKRMEKAQAQRKELPVARPGIPPDAPEYHLARASADSHARRMAAIEANKQREKAERDGTSKDGGFKAW